MPNDSSTSRISERMRIFVTNHLSVPSPHVQWSLIGMDRSSVTNVVTRCEFNDLFQIYLAYSTFQIRFLWDTLGHVFFSLHFSLFCNVKRDRAIKPFSDCMYQTFVVKGTASGRHWKNGVLQNSYCDTLRSRISTSWNWKLIMKVIKQLTPRSGTYSPFTKAFSSFSYAFCWSWSSSTHSSSRHATPRLIIAVLGGVNLLLCYLIRYSSTNDFFSRLANHIKLSSLKISTRIITWSSPLKSFDFKKAQHSDGKRKLVWPPTDLSWTISVHTWQTSFLYNLPVPPRTLLCWLLYMITLLWLCCRGFIVCTKIRT